MGFPYSVEELLALQEIETKYGSISYQTPAFIEAIFYDMTGKQRSSGCLYMAMWRLKKGYYDLKLARANRYDSTLTSSDSCNQLTLL